MQNTDITNTNLYFKKLINVIKSSIPADKNLQVSARYSDAFIYVLSGSCSYKFNDNTQFTVNKGDILFLASNASYKMLIGHSEYKFIFCDFEFDSSSARKSAYFTPIDEASAENLFKKLYRTYSYQNEFTFFECMSYLYEIYSTVSKSQHSKYLDKTVREKIDDIKQYMKNNFSDSSLTVSSLADKAGMSEVYFRKIFKSAYNTSPAKYLTTLRITEAKQLLSYPFISLEECSKKCGYNSLQYFCRVFKNITGITPLNFKNGKKD